MNVHQPTSVKKYPKQIPSNIEYICWMYIRQKQFQKERPANIEYIWWMFPWEGSSFPVSLTMATSANGHNLTVTSGHILIFYIWNKSKRQSDKTANPSLYCASRGRRGCEGEEKTIPPLYSVGISLATSCSTCWCQSLTTRVLWTKVLDNSQIRSNHNSPHRNKFRG